MFEDDDQINNFLTLEHEFSNINIDTDVMNDSQQQTTENQHENQQAVTASTAKQILNPTVFDKTDIE